jgi:predicted short-subunit dehydrogenase-like oxidoreductase (DUF2520 family)
MEIVIIGTGNVATILGRKLKEAGHVIVQVCGRTAATTDALATEWSAAACYAMKDLNRTAGFYLIALADTALHGIDQQLSLPGKLVAHTAGSVSKDVLRHVSEQHGIFYPLQSLRKEMAVIPDIPLFIDAATPEAHYALSNLAGSITEQVHSAGDEQRMQLHLAAVMVNNFTNHLYGLAEKYCLQHALDFKQLLPLIKETAQRIEQYSPASVQTGPAIRNDLATIQRHLDMLKDYPTLQQLYEQMTKSILNSRI